MFKKIKTTNNSLTAKTTNNLFKYEVIKKYTIYINYILC